MTYNILPILQKLKHTPLVIILALGVLTLSNAQALAACVNPAGSAGDMMYNSTHNVMQFCDGTDWTAMKGGAANGDNLGSGGSTSGTLYTTNQSVGRDSGDRTVYVNNARQDLYINGVREYMFYPTTFRTNATNTNNLGTSSVKWKNGYFAGNIYANAYFHNSDRNLKKDIKDIEDPFALLNAIHGKHYLWKKDNIPAYGVIAQDVETVMAEAVLTDHNGLKSVEYDQLIAPLIEAVKAQQVQIEAMQAEIDTLKAQ